MNLVAVDMERAPARERRLKWRITSLLMRTVGRTSSGIDMGYLYGFDSGVMLDKVYENRASGKYLIGTVIDWFYLRAIGWRAIRARGQLLKRILLEQISELTARAAGSDAQKREARPLVLADVAAGPGRYLLEMCRDLRATGHGTAEELTVICRDLSPGATERGKVLAHEFGLDNVRHEAGDAIDPASLATITPRPDIVVVSGLYELFTDAALIKKSMEGIYRLLGEGGRMVFTTQVTHPQLEFIANVLVNRDGEPWVMLCRPISEVEALAEEIGFRVVKSEMESLGLFAITICEKIGG